MRQSAFIIVIFFLATTLSCDKSGFGSIQGYVYDSFTGEAIAGAKVQLGYSGISKSDRWVKYATTDGLGHYKISYYKKGSKTYYLFASSESYYGPAASSTSVDHRKTNCNMYLNPVAQVKFRVVNNTSANATIIIEKYGTNEESLTVRPTHDTLSSALHRANGDGETKIGWILGSNGNYYVETVEIHTGPSVVTHTIYIN